MNSGVIACPKQFSRTNPALSRRLTYRKRKRDKEEDRKEKEQKGEAKKIKKDPQQSNIKNKPSLLGGILHPITISDNQQQEKTPTTPQKFTITPPFNLPTSLIPYVFLKTTSNNSINFLLDVVPASPSSQKQHYSLHAYHLYSGTVPSNPPKSFDNPSLYEYLQIFLFFLKTISLRLRKQNKKHRNFNLDGTTQVGYTVNALNAKGFSTPHNFTKHLGVAKDPLKQKISNWRKELWVKGRTLCELLDPEYARRELVIYVSLMTSSNRAVRWHDDKRDITFQIAIFLGQFSEHSFFELEDPTSSFTIRIPLTPGTVIIFDGRLRHRKVAGENFSGTMYTVIFFKNYDSKISKAAPILWPPQQFHLPSRQ